MTRKTFIGSASAFAAVLGLGRRELAAAVKAVLTTEETGPDEYRELRRQLRAFHPDECHGRCKAPEFDASFKAIHAELDAFVASTPGYDALDLRRVCYLAERRHFAPFLFTESPFYFTAGVNGGWVVRNNPSWYVRDLGERFFTETCGVPQEAIQRRDDRVDNRFSVCCGTFTDTGHHQPAFRRILKLGFGGIRREVEAALASCPADDPHGRKTLETALVGFDTVHEIQLAFARKARTALDAGGLPERTRRWYRRIAESASRCPWEPPRSFYEGLNALWFIREVLGYVDNTLCNSLGRPDAWLIDLYRRDLAEGRITEAEARDLVCRFMVHADCHHDGMVPVRGYADHEAEIPIVLGGCDGDGRPVYNELTRMFLDEHLRCGLVFPKLHVRYSAASPKEYLLKIGTMLMKDHAVFAMFNDDIHVPQYERMGLSTEDARAYLACGCWDGFVDGVTDIDAANYMSTVRILELTIYRDPELERKLGLKIDSIDGAASYEEVRDTVYRNFIRFVRGVMSDYTRYGRATAYVTPYPVHSMCYRGAPAKRRDINEGGAPVSPRIMTLAFLANTVDSLLAIKRVCFDEKACTLAEFLSAVRGNWSGERGERLRMQAMASPYWGDHSAASDGLMRWWIARVSEDIDGFTSGTESPYVLAMWVYREFLLWGEKTRATPDGRRDGDRLAQGLAPSEYRCKEGATTVINAIGTLPHELLYASNANLSFDKTAMNAETLAAIFRVAAKKRLHLLQPNCTSVEELLDAKEHPERHQDLIVKVCGFSARFIALSPKFQDEVINRHRLR